jgi:ribosomal 50S subunit-recycling heat shock protein
MLSAVNPSRVLEIGQTVEGSIAEAIFQSQVLEIVSRIRGAEFKQNSQSTTRDSSGLNRYD